MPGAFVVIVVAGAALWFFRQAGRMSPREVKAFSSKVFGFVLLGVGLLFSMRGGLMAALPLFAAGAGLLGFAKLWPVAAVRPTRNQQPPPDRPVTIMDRAEALSVLGLGASATRQDVISAHKRLQRTNHPDVGGSDYLAGKINQARDVLLKN